MIIDNNLSMLNKLRPTMDNTVDVVHSRERPTMQASSCFPALFESSVESSRGFFPFLH